MAPVGSTKLALASHAGVAVGQTLTGPGIASGTTVSGITAITTKTGAAAKGEQLVQLSPNAAGVAVGQAVSGDAVVPGVS